MIHYHGTPIGGSRQDVARFLTGRHALIPYPRQDDLGAVAEGCQSFVFDNGAFSTWKRGLPLDVPGYTKWVREWCKHPGFQWALIPDEIEGDEEDNDAHIEAWRDAGLAIYGVPVWHLHESTERLAKLADEWPTVALGSSGQWPDPGRGGWWNRIAEAMSAICDEAGRPACRLHGLRMMNPAIFEHLPLASADSTNVAQNNNKEKRFGMYVPPTSAQRAAVIADRIEACNSAPVWVSGGTQCAFAL